MAQPTAEIVYPESDGQPIGENTLQVRWINALWNGFSAYFRDRLDVFVAADLFWYPVEAKPKRVTAPDVMIAFGRPKGERRSYKQWEEGGVAPQVVIEVLSPSNTVRARDRLLKFYHLYGVEEFYEYDPDARELTVTVRTARGLRPTRTVRTHTSARLGVRFEVPRGDELVVYASDGTRFRTYDEVFADGLAAQAREAEARLVADREARRAAEATRRAEEEARRADDEARKAAEFRQENERMKAKLRELGLDPDAP